MSPWTAYARPPDSDGPDGSVRLTCFKPVHQNGRALGREGRGDARTRPSPPTGNEGEPIGQFEIHDRSSVLPRPTVALSLARLGAVPPRVRGAAQEIKCPRERGNSKAEGSAPLACHRSPSRGRTCELSLRGTCGTTASHNGPAISVFRLAVGRLWKRALERRSQRTRISWARMQRLISRWLPPARICHPYPLVRLGVVTQGGSRMR